MSPKTKKIITIVVIIAIIAIGLWFIFKKPKAAASTPAALGSPLPIKFPLKSGSTGEGVKQVQKYLNTKYGASLKVDGSWGPLTTAAALLYLKRDNVSEDVYIKWALASI